MGYDLIGDIHGHCDALISLLERLGYQKIREVYKHPEERQVIFVGDYIDRGPQIPETLALVKAMVDEGQAIALMGNHEYNAILFNALSPSVGGYLRKHSIKNIVQHYETLRQFKGADALYQNYIDWFMTLPLFYENDVFRVVHACWDSEAIAYLSKELGGNLLKQSILKEAVTKGSTAYGYLNNVLKGKELKLPAGVSFLDKDGFERKNTRIKWWLESRGMSWNDYAISLPNPLPELTIKTTEKAYENTEKPVFFGHYWLKGIPTLMTKNVCCLDYSIAKGDKLAAYRWDGNPVLSIDNFVWV